MLWHHIGCLLGVRARADRRLPAPPSRRVPPPMTDALSPTRPATVAQLEVAAFVVPRGFPLYFAGVVALELGSGVCNVFYLEAPPQGAGSCLYAVGMTVHQRRRVGVRAAVVFSATSSSRCRGPQEVRRLLPDVGSSCLPARSRCHEEDAAARSSRHEDEGRRRSVVARIRRRKGLFCQFGCAHKAS